MCFKFFLDSEVLMRFLISFVILFKRRLSFGFLNLFQILERSFFFFEFVSDFFRKTLVAGVDGFFGIFSWISCVIVSSSAMALSIPSLVRSSMFIFLILSFAESQSNL